MKNVFRFDVDLYMNKYKFSHEKNAKKSIENAKKRRICSILTPVEVVEKFKAGELKKTNGMVPVYIYHDKTGVCPEASLQFYDAEGYLMWTYPWNGKVNLSGVMGCPFDAFSKKFNRIEVAVSDKGKVAIRENSFTHFYDKHPEKEETIKFFEANGKEIQLKNLLPRNYPNKNLCDDYGFVSDKFHAFAVDGDKFIDYCNSSEKTMR